MTSRDSPVTVYKCSPVAEMGNRLATVDMGRKLGGGGLCPFWEGELGSRLTVWPRPRSTSLQSGILIRSAIWPQYMGRKVGDAAQPPLFCRGNMGPHLTVSPGPRPTSVPSGILIRQPFGHNRHGPKIGGGLRPFREELGSHLTQ